MGFGYGIYFTDRLRNRVIRWDPDTGKTEVLAGEPKDGDPSQKLSDPHGLAFDQAGCLLIADKYHNRICRLRKGLLEPLPLRDPDGHRARRPDGPGYFNPAHFSAPTSLCAETSGSILCAFFGDQTIYRIHADGRLELVLGMVRNQHYAHERIVETVAPSLIRSAPINGPTGVIADSSGTVYFIERNYQLVRRYHPATGLSSIFPRSQYESWVRLTDAPSAGRIDSYYPAFPASLTLDAHDNLYLCDPNHGCVLKIDLEKGQFRQVIRSQRSPGAPVGRGPIAMTFGTDGTAWVADASPGTIQSYSPSESGEWKPMQNQLANVNGSSLVFVPGGMGLIVGR